VTMLVTIMMKSIDTAKWQHRYNASATPAQREDDAAATKWFQRMRPFHPPVKPVDSLKSVLATFH